MNISPYQTNKTTSKNIEIVYLLDILFLLLLLFMVYAVNAKPTNSIVLDFPQSKNGVNHSKTHVSIVINQTKIVVNQQECKNKVSLCLQQQKITSKQLLIIKAPKNLILQKFVLLMDELQNNKYHNIQLEVSKF